MTACLAKVRYEIISGRRPAVGRRFNTIAASLKSWSTVFDRFDGACLGYSRLEVGCSARPTPNFSSRHRARGGVLESLGHFSFGPVVLVHTQKIGIQSEKPTWTKALEFTQFACPCGTDLRPLSGEQRTSHFKLVMSVNDHPSRTSAMRRTDRTFWTEDILHARVRAIAPAMICIITPTTHPSMIIIVK
jgi:hypothetical protein